MLFVISLQRRAQVNLIVVFFVISLQRRTQVNPIMVFFVISPNAARWLTLSWFSS
jgi:hypothetical protein